VSESTPASYKLYNSGQVFLASFLGGPLAGCALLALNARRMASRPRPGVIIILGTVLTAALFGVGFVLPKNFPSAALPVASSVGLRQVATQLQGARIASHVAAGGKKGSYLAAAGVGVSFLVVTLVIVAAVVLILPDGTSVLQ